ncbi:MAG: hypothetical protein ACJAV5_000484 [Vicingaceae bacterium]|jgi:hypothetical protein
MKHLTLLSILLFTCFAAFAQPQRKCGFDAIQQRISEHQNFDNYLLNKNLIYKNSKQNKMDTVIRIPVVVHVIYRLISENISTAQINSQIAVLNKDFRKLNPDTTNAAGWSKADVKFEFILATKDPSGNPSNGITRTSTTVDNIGLSNQYFNLVPAWNRDRYLNIWVCDVGPNLLGFAYPPNAPGVTAQEDGVVVGSNYFGTTGTVQAPWNQGRTTTHEIGHFFDLLHLWGTDFNPGCNTDDLISDTPNQDGPEPNCGSRSSCGSADQMSNFLQYVDDACMGNFTLGQKTRMRTALYTQRDSLQFGGLFEITSISELPIQEKALIYPNPSKGVFQIELPENTNINKVEIEVIDLTGKLVRSQTKQDKNGLIVSIDSAPSGVYFVRIMNGEFSSTKKLIKH